MSTPAEEGRPARDAGGGGPAPDAGGGPPARDAAGGEPTADAGSGPPARDLRSPVRRIATDPERYQPTPGIGLCLSGGGYRAMLFHVGSLWRLNEAGYLPRLDRISSVSGGSIVAGVLASRWDALGFSAGGVAHNFAEEVLEPLRRLAGKTLDIPTVLLGLLTPWTTINERLASRYRRALYGRRTLQDLPDRPQFVVNATSLQTGELWRFTKAEQGDWRVGEMASPSTQLARAVAASSAFPPVLSPAVVKMAEGQMRPGADPTVARPPYTTRVVLTDGGVYDNLGLEAVWKKYNTVLISDGGAHMGDSPSPTAMWILQAVRVLETINQQVLDLRKQQAVSSFADGERDGAYWGIRSHVRDFGLADPILDPSDTAIAAIAGIPTRLARLDAPSQERLINWGYLICDTALRRWVDPGQPKGALPYPATGVAGAG